MVLLSLVVMCWLVLFSMLVIIMCVFLVMNWCVFVLFWLWVLFVISVILFLSCFIVFVFVSERGCVWFVWMWLLCLCCGLDCYCVMCGFW